MKPEEQLFATAALFLIAGLSYLTGRLHQSNKDSAVREELAARNSEVECLHAELANLNDAGRLAQPGPLDSQLPRLSGHQYVT